MYFYINIYVFSLTHSTWVMHICIGNATIIGSDNGLLPGWCKAIMWTNAVILLLEILGTNFSEISIAIHTFSLNKLHFINQSGKWQPFCLGLNVLNLLKWLPVAIYSACQMEWGHHVICGLSLPLQMTHGWPTNVSWWNHPVCVWVCVCGIGLGVKSWGGSQY